MCRGSVARSTSMSMWQAARHQATLSSKQALKQQHRHSELTGKGQCGVLLHDSKHLIMVTSTQPAVHAPEWVFISRPTILPGKCLTSTPCSVHVQLAYMFIGRMNSLQGIKPEKLRAEKS